MVSCALQLCASGKFSMSEQESTPDPKQQVEEFLASPELARVVESDEFKRFLRLRLTSPVFDRPRVGAG
jgi:hypothetical protein